ncbi:polysaccharide deacetylase family protein [Paenibacillus sp. YN15]|uniref:polysaccharide deacetylase family protein n=1 Tax=Paenibacillus sp. YN15 TaxID=1742774 RepID=UPI00215CDE88|nr:polysaccharide deacetylase family protein [Paenibacillus sp. YN15]
MKMSQRAALYAGAVVLLLAAVAVPVLFDMGDKPFEPALAQVAQTAEPASPSPAESGAAAEETETASSPDQFAAAIGTEAVVASPSPEASAAISTLAAAPDSSGPPSPAAPSTTPATAGTSVTASVYNGGSGSPKVSIAVLYYHSVQVMPGSTAVISPAKFTEQMQYLADNGYHPLTMAEFSDIMEGRTAAPEKPVLLTFDDGYVDNHSTVMPLLSKLDFPATLFMSPGVMDDKRFISWEQAEDLRDSGWDIMPHGMTHPYLTKLTPEEQAWQITEARKQIEEKLGVTADVFCYPYGEYNNTTLQILKDNGFRYAFTIDQGKTTPKQHPYKLKRVFVNGEEDLSALVRKLTKW